MADVNANIGVNIDTSAALAQLKSLQRQISQFHSSISKSSEAAALAQRDLQRNFLNSVNSIGAFSAELRTVKTTSESFTSSLEKNKFSMREYFRLAGASTKTFGKLFKSEYDTIGRVAEDRVKKLQTQYIKMGRDATGAMKAIAIIPNELDMSNYSTQLQLTAQRQALFNQLMKQGSTNLLNFGKNTQWAGRQLMVGFTLPLMAAGAAASKSFMQMEAQALKFKKVYGDLFTSPEETQQALGDIQELARQFTKYGIAVADTVGLAADAAAAGFQGVDLQRQTTEATRLSVLGQIDNQQALETTIALQNAFNISSEELAQSIDFLNAVENQTVVSLDDVTTAIPKVAPVIRQLGGDVKDLAFFLTAMKEGGINASEGANALKSGLASLINPSSRARDMLQGLGIDINAIVNNNKGDLRGTVVGFAQALDTLAPLERARAIEQMFGKFQFARLSALFQNVTRDGTQASRVLQLAGSSIEDLASLSEQELGKTADSAMNKFKKSVEDLKVAIVPVGEAFLKTVTPIIDFIGTIAEKFSNLSEGTKKAITIMVTVIGGLGPVLLMTFGLLANGVANIIKLFLTLRMGYQRLTGQSQNLGEQTQYLNNEQLDAAAAAHSLNQAHATLTQQFTVEAEALQRLIAAYTAATAAGAKFASLNPGMMVAPRPRQKFSTGGYVRGPGGPTSDEVPIMASNGEVILPVSTVNANKEAVDSLLKTGKFEPKIDLNSGRSLRGTITNGGLLPEITSEQIEARNKRALAQIEANKARRAAQQMLPAPNVPNVIPQKKTTNTALEKYGPVPIGPDGKPAQYGHITTRINSSVDDILAELLALPEEIKKKRQAEIYKLQDLQSLGGGKEDVNAYTSLATYQSSKLNQAIGEGTSMVPVQSFIDDFDHFGTDMFIPALKDGGATLQQVEGELTHYHSALKEAVIQKGKENGTAEITGKQYEALEKELRKTLPATSKLRQALNSAEARIDELRINLSSEFGRNVNAQRPDLIANKGTRNESILVTGASGRAASTKVRLRGERYPKRDILGRQAMLAASQAGEDLGGATTDGAAKGAATQSPSKKTIKVGEDVARGLEVGMNNRKNNVAKSGEALADTAVKATRRVATRASGAPGVNNMIMAGSTTTRRAGSSYRPQGPSNVPTAVLRDTEQQMAKSRAEASARLAQQQIAQQKALVEAEEKTAIARQASTARLGKLNNALQGGSFALMSLSGIAQMFGGRLGDISNKVFAVSGALFALQTVTQLLTQAKALELIQSKLAVAKQAAAFATYGAGMGAKSGLIGALARFGIRLTAFLGPIGIATAAVSGLAIGFKLLRDAQERERQSIEGLGNAAQLTDEKLTALGGIFNVVARKSAFERGTTAKTGEVQVGSQTRSQLETLKSDKGFQDAFKKDIAALKGATNSQAGLIFDSLAIELKGKGYAAEQIKTIITALQEEAGKTKVKFDVKSIDVSTKEGQDRLANNVEKLTKSLSKNLSNGITTVYRQVYDPKKMQWITTPFTELSKAAKKNLNLVSKSITSMFAGLSGQLESGIITADQFNSAFVRISNTIEAMPKAQALVLMEKLLSSLPEKLRASANGIGSISSQLLLLKAQAAGVAVTAEIIAAMTTAEKASGPNAGGRKAKANDTIENFEKKIAAAAAAYKKLNDAFAEGTVTGGSGTGSDTLSAQAKLTLARLGKELDALKTKRDIINESNDALKRQYDYQQRLMQLSKDATQAKISGDFIGANILEQQKSFETGQFNKETDALALDKKIMQLENRISELNANAKVTAAEKRLNDLKKKTGKAMGGLIKGPGTGSSDSIAARFAKGGLPQLAVSNGEYIVQASSVQKYGVGFMDALNNQKVSSVSSNTSSSTGSTVYNIDMVINGGDAGTIADQVIKRLKIETSKNNKSNMVRY